MHRAWSTYLDGNRNKPPQSVPDSMHRSGESRPSSIASAQTHNSTRHLMDPNNSLADSRQPSYASLSPSKPGGGGDAPLLGPSRPESPAASLSQHYMPQKFAPLSNIRKRTHYAVPKRGGGREAFSAGASRMPDARDEDYDGVQFGAAAGSGKSRMGWNRFKWILFFANTILTAYSLLALIFTLLTWFNVWHHADVVRVANRPELIISTLASTLGVLTSLIGWAGILLNNRAFLAIYTFLLWVVFGLLVTPGYITYKFRTFALEGKLNEMWSRDLGADGRLRIQDALGCCGYNSPFTEASVSQTCYSRSTLAGCKNAFLKFERQTLERWYIVAFGLVPVHIGIIIAGLLCSNHVTYRYGKGMMPKAYQLSMNSMAVIMDNYANQLADQYGADVASEALARSRSNLQLDTMPQVNYK